MKIIIALAFSLGVFSENIFGFGGTIVAMSILSFWIDPDNIKDLIFIIFLVTNFSASIITLTSYKKICLKILKSMLLPSFFGLLIGAYFLKIFSSQLILRIFALFILFYGANSLFGKKIWHFPKIVKKFFLFISGLVTGLFGGGGVFAVMAFKESFKNKSQMRATLMAFFVFCNITRGVQYFYQKTFDFSKIMDFWWIFPPIFLAFLIGSKVHIKVSEKFFYQGISILIFLAGISLFIKSFI